MRRVGVITYLETFQRALQDLGWADGRNIRFDYRFTGDSEDRMRGMAEEIVGLAPDIILASTNSVASATPRAPSGNIPGFHNFAPAIGGKWLAYLSQIEPMLRRVAVIHVQEIAPNVAFLRVIETAQMGLAVTPAHAAQLQSYIHREGNRTASHAGVGGQVNAAAIATINAIAVGPGRWT